MITSRDVNYEFNQAYKKVKEAKTIQEIGEILVKLIHVVSKEVLSNRGNTVKIMEKLKIEKTVPKRTDLDESTNEEK